jgi:hypothetical protein
LKKEAKTFPYWRARRGSLNAMRTKVFWFFFQKRTACFRPSGEAQIWVSNKGSRSYFWRQMNAAFRISRGIRRTDAQADKS